MPLPEAAEAAPIRYVALDLAGDERLPPAQIGLVGARDVLTMLEEERVPPLVAVRQHTAPAHAGSCASAVPAFWTVCVTATSGAAYAVGTLAMAELHHSVLGGLYAETLARATGGRAGSGSSGTFSIDVGWEPVRQPSAPAALNSAWQHVAGTAAGLDVMRLRDECFRGSALNVTIRSPVVSSHLSQPTVEVLLQLSDAVLVQLSPSESTPASAIQTSVLLECSLECELQPAVNTDNLAIVASGVQCFVCSSLGGCQGASMLALSVDAARVEHGERLVLLGASGHSESTLDVLRVSRPAGQPFVAGGRLQVPAEARLRATISGCTLAMDTEGIGMSWLSSMWAFFAPSGNALESSPELASAAAGGAGSGSPDARLHLRRVALQRSALGRQCCGAVPTVLLLGEMSWRAEHGGDGGELLLRDVSLHVAEPALSEGRRAASLAAGLASLDLLDAAGFSQVLSEPCVRVLMRKGTEVEVENTQLMVTLSQRTAGLVQALVSQALQQIPSGNAAGGAGTGGINCWQDDLQASVPLEGGWIEDVASKSLTPPGSPPTLVEHPLAHESSSDK